MGIGRTDIKKMLETTGYPVAFGFFEKGELPPPPYIVYLTPGSSNFFADGVVYEKITRVQIELYTKYVDEAAEMAVERAISEYPWDYSQEYIDSEQIYQTIYEIEV